MIEFVDHEHLAKVLTFAIENQCIDKLMGRLEYLAQYGDGKNKCVIGQDWAPNSFTFSMYDESGKHWFVGGLIYSGPGQPLDGSAPALTVGIGVDS